MVQGDFQASGSGTITAGNDKVTLTPTGVNASSKIFIQGTGSTGSPPLDFQVENKGIDTFDVVSQGGVVIEDVLFDWIAFEG